MKAAIFHGAHQALTVEDVDIDEPLEHEVIVRVVASGVCHSDLHFVDGFYEFPAPAILGHEAAGIVEQVGHGFAHCPAEQRVVIGDDERVGGTHGQGLRIDRQAAGTRHFDESWLHR